MDNRANRKPKKFKYRFSIVFFVTVLIFGVVFYNYMKNTTLEDVLANEKEQPSVTDSQTTTAPDNVEQVTDISNTKEIVNPVPESEKLANDYFNNCVFIGDSITYGLSTYGLVPVNSVYASVGMSLQKAETAKIDTQYGKTTVLDALQQRNPENIYIMLGSNGAAYMQISEMYQAYTAFVSKAAETCPNANIYIISVPPVTAGKEESKESPILNLDISAFNDKLLDFANTKGYNYLDLHSALADESGKLPDAVAENDGMHFKLSAYETFVDYILTHVAK